LAGEREGWPVVGYGISGLGYCWNLPRRRIMATIKPNHQEARQLASYLKEKSNMARSYLDIVDFIESDLLGILCSLENMLSIITENSSESSVIIDAKKSIDIIREITERFKSN
jgi:hypothetical protein